MAQAKAFATTLMTGDPDQSHMLLDTAKQVLSAVLPGRKDEK
jgi:pyruvate dehydrogenase (quinone)